MKVPAYEITYQRPKRHDYAICVFVINEGEKVRKQLRGMKAYSEMVDVIVADGGSNDGSLTVELMQETDTCALLVKTGPGKLSAQMRMAFKFCLDEGYAGVITIDGNGKDGIEAIPRFVELLRQGYDHVQGSRFVKGGLHSHTPLARLLAVNILHAPLISLAAGFRYTDTTNGFRGYSRNLLEDSRVQPFRDVFSTYELHYYLAIRAAKLGFLCVETPVSRVYPSKGPVPTKIKGFSGNLFVLKTLLKAVNGKWDPKS